MSIGAVKVSTATTIWTASRTSTLLEYQLLTRAQALAMVVVAVFAGFTPTIEMIVIADFLVFYAFREANGSCWIGSWQRRIEAFIVNVEEDKLAVRCFFACNVDGLRRAFAYCRLSRALARNRRSCLGQIRCSCLCWGRCHAISGD